MNSRALIIGISLTLCGAAVAGVVVQGRRLDVLRSEQQRLHLEVEELHRLPAAPKISEATATPAAATPITPPSSELLRLRNQVSLLNRRQQELASVPVEHERLVARLAQARTNSSPALPPGYIRKSEARLAGYATPEATLESMLWSLQHRDFTNFLASFSSETAADLEKQMVRTGKTVDDFFAESIAFPGANIVGRKTRTNGTIELQVEIVPGVPSQKMRFRQVNGEWKMENGGGT